MSGKTRPFFVFDIETGPLPDSEIERIAPPFDPESVKMGRLRDVMAR